MTKEEKLWYARYLAFYEEAKDMEDRGTGLYSRYMRSRPALTAEAGALNEKDCSGGFCRPENRKPPGACG